MLGDWTFPLPAWVSVVAAVLLVASLVHMFGARARSRVHNEVAAALAAETMEADKIANPVIRRATLLVICDRAAREGRRVRRQRRVKSLVVAPVLMVSTVVFWAQAIAWAATTL